jgi:hypothetical protein
MPGPLFKDIVLTINLKTLNIKFSLEDPLPSKVVIEWIRGIYHVTPSNINIG